jgi:hypothetical protein
MKRDWNVIPGLRYSVLLVSMLFISACAAKLVDIDKSLPKLNLSEEQSEVVRPKMIAIKGIVDQYNAEKEELEEEMSSNMAGFRGGGMGQGMGGGMGRGMGRGRGGGDRGGPGGEFEEFRKRREEFLKKREAYLSAIETHIADIKAVLDEEQLATFEKMKLPELEMPEMPGRGGGMPGGGMGGGGRPPGGGMF